MTEELPYFAGKEIPEEYLEAYFFDRKKEIEELRWKLERKPALNFALYGQRRLGKTSLIEKINKVLKKKCLPILIKCEELLPLDELTFLQNFAIKLLDEYSKIEKLIKIEKTLKELAARTKIGLEIADITFWLKFGEKKITVKEALDKCFELIDKIALKSKRKVIIFLDEFQEIFGFGDKFLWALRAKISSSKASFVVSSSWHRFYHEITNEKRPFFNFFETYEIKEVPRNDAKEYLLRRAKRFNLKFDASIAENILDVSECKPFYLQLLALKCYVLSMPKKIVNKAIFEKALEETIKNIPAHLVASFAALKGRKKDVFVALCLYDLKKPADIAKKISMEPKNVIVILGRLIKDYGIVKKIGQEYYVSDNFLKGYVKLEYTTTL